VAEGKERSGQSGVRSNGEEKELHNARQLQNARSGVVAFGLAPEGRDVDTKGLGGERPVAVGGGERLVDHVALHRRGLSRRDYRRALFLLINTRQAATCFKT